MKKFLKTLKNKIYLLKFTDNYLAYSDIEALKNYLTHGGDPNRAISGAPLLSLYSDIEYKRLLLEFGADPNKTSDAINANKGMTPLEELFVGYNPLNTVFIYEEQIEHLQSECALLLKYGANPNIPMKFSNFYLSDEKIENTILSLAVSIGDASIVSALLHYGAKVNNQCFDICTKPEIAELLLSYTPDTIQTDNEIVQAVLDKRILKDNVTSTTRKGNIVKI